MVAGADVTTAMAESAKVVRVVNHAAIASSGRLKGKCAMTTRSHASQRKRVNRANLAASVASRARTAKIKP